MNILNESFSVPSTHHLGRYSGQARQTKLRRKVGGGKSRRFSMKRSRPETQRLF
jgi:hypothetical protein